MQQEITEDLTIVLKHMIEHEKEKKFAVLNKCRKVLMSCTDIDQLEIGIKFYKRAYELGMLDGYEKVYCWGVACGISHTLGYEVIKEAK